MNPLSGAIFGCLIIAASAAYAQDSQNDALPDILDLQDVAMAFDGLTSVRVNNYADFDLIDGTTLETWFAPNWFEDLSYDPCILTLVSGDKNVLSVSVGSNRDYIGLSNGIDYITPPVELDPEGMNHLTVVASGSNWEVFSNGNPSGLIYVPPVEAKIDLIDVGGCGLFGPSYIGWLSNLRVWNAPLNLVDVSEYLPVTDNLGEEDHPYWPMLRAWMIPAGDDGVIVANSAEIFLGGLK